MKHRLSVYSSLCTPATFEVNGVDADYDDFGDKWDRSPDDDESYGCGDMHFTPTDPTPQVLAKYSITRAEYVKIADELEDKLSFGSCGWCV